MPAYNAASVIGETIESVIAQTFTDWTLTIVDDGSSDATVDAANAYAARDPRVRVVRIPIRAGRPAGPRNHGVALTESQYVAFLDADDLWHPQKLEIQLGEARRHGAGFVSSTCADFVRRDEIAAAIGRTLPSVQPVTAIPHARLIRKNIIPTSSVLLERRLLEGLKFDERPEYRAVEDFDLWLRIHRRAGPSIKIQQPLVYYRKSAGSISKSKLDMLRKNAMLLREHLEGQRFAGLKRVLYLGTYVTHSIFFRLLRRQL
jgi:glycosyltransferase involved in cell wall biosynthesis